ncbi:hypothetical protein CV102_22485 [Natronococcus pandeyae]|uniref:Uncharacterized protein n=2 Tax=Natronococcus pandeyae TaxID=2055836 RepID=A0A8J8TQC7_9EURY|nr:hypothetical protein CV102_22485 [Natronococcus pandeyae]
MIGGGVFGVVLHTLGEITVVSYLVGTRAEPLAWILLLVIGILGAITYYLTIRRFVLLEFLAAEPRTGAALGLAFGILLWFAAIIIVPVWIVFYGITSTIPYVHIPSLVGLVVYGMIVGGLTPLIAKHIDSEKKKVSG